jgi:hypothetical protein
MELYYDVIAIKMDIAEDDLEKIIIRNIKDNIEIDYSDSYRMLSEVI